MFAHKPPLTFRTSGTPRVSVVLVNWNRCDDIVAIVAALRRQHFDDFEVIVVDNGSTDDSVERLRRETDVKLVLLDDNLGPSAARNIGVAEASGEYICFLDSDAFLSRKGLRKLVETMDREPEVGLVGCRVMNYYSRGIDQWIYPESYATHGNVQFDAYSFSAAGAIVRRELFSSVGGFWDRLFIYNEEVELSIKIHRAGYRVLYTPDVSVFHRVAPSGRAPSKAYFFYQSRNWIWIFYRHYPPIWRWRKVAQYCVVYSLKGIGSREMGSVFRGLVCGLKETRILSEFPRKLTNAQVKQLEALNRRSRVRSGR